MKSQGERWNFVGEPCLGNRYGTLASPVGEGLAPFFPYRPNDIHSSIPDKYPLFRQIASSIARIKPTPTESQSNERVQVTHSC